MPVLRGCYAQRSRPFAPRRTKGKCPIGAYAWGNHDAVEKWNTRALRSATPMPGVKPLEWREFATSRHDYGHGVWDANGPWTTYSIWDCFEAGFDDEDRYYARAISKSFHTVEAAKAAVQADFEARILSALTTPPAREVSEAEVERAAIPPAPKPVEDLLSILAEIVAISDRDHVAWRRAKALIEMSRVTNHSHQIARGDR